MTTKKSAAAPVAEVRTVLEATWTALRSWLGELPRETYDVPSVLTGWTVGDLVAHLGRGVEAVANTHRADEALSGAGFAAGAGTSPAAAERVRPLSIGEYVGTYAQGAAEIAEGARSLAAEATADPLGALDASWARACAALDELSGSPAPSAAGSPIRTVADDPVVVARRGPILLSDLLVTRVLELVVHADDLDRSLPDQSAPVVPREAVRLVVRTLLDALVELAPGRSVEVRVPPFAAVQCIEGPRHTRGTPANVIEAGPTTWVRLACGRIAWADARADGSVRASGERADLSGYLPLL